MLTGDPQGRRAACLSCIISRMTELLNIEKRGDAFCDDQFAGDAPAELPTAPVATTVRQLEPPAADGMGRFDFERMAGHVR